MKELERLDKLHLKYDVFSMIFYHFLTTLSSGYVLILGIIKNDKLPMKKPAILLLSVIFLSTLTWCQNVTSDKTIISASTTSSLNTNAADLPFFSSPADAEKIVSGIMDAMGLESKFIVKVADVPNVEAAMKHHERYILYNPSFVDQVNQVTKNKWASIFILAHEVGHHLDGDTQAGLKSCPEIELKADQFAGFVLCKMGATLQQAQLAMYYISDVASSKTHPGRVDRLGAIAKGWNKAQMQKQSANGSTQIEDDHL